MLVRFLVATALTFLAAGGLCGALDTAGATTWLVGGVVSVTGMTAWLAWEEGR